MKNKKKLAGTRLSRFFERKFARKKIKKNGSKKTSFATKRYNSFAEKIKAKEALLQEQRDIAKGLKDEFGKDSSEYKDAIERRDKTAAKIKKMKEKLPKKGIKFHAKLGGFLNKATQKIKSFSANIGGDKNIKIKTKKNIDNKIGRTLSPKALRSYRTLLSNMRQVEENEKRIEALKTSKEEKKIERDEAKDIYKEKDTEIVEKHFNELGEKIEDKYNDPDKGLDTKKLIDLMNKRIDKINEDVEKISDLKENYESLKQEVKNIKDEQRFLELENKDLRKAMKETLKMYKDVFNIKAGAGVKKNDIDIDVVKSAGNKLFKDTAFHIEDKTTKPKTK